MRYFVSSTDNRYIVDGMDGRIIAVATTGDDAKFIVDILNRSY